MKILFLCKYTKQINDSVYNKVTGEMNALVSLGHIVHYLEWRDNSFFLTEKNSGKVINSWSDNCFVNKNKYYHSLYFVRMYQLARKIIMLYEYDFVYIRNSIFFINAIRFVNLLKNRKIGLLLEIPTFPFDEERAKEKRLLHKLWFFVQGITEKIIYKNVDLFVLCAEQRYDMVYGKPAINLFNGVDTSILKLRKPCLHNDEVHLLCLANMCYWQAYDRLIYSLSRYKDKDKVFIHLVGPDADGSLVKWIALTEELHLTKNVVIHGAVYGSELDDLFNFMDAGIGCLGMYRKGLERSANLKTREYLGRGLPIVVAAIEDCVPKNSPFMLKVENNDNVIDMAEIVNFCQKFKINGATEYIRKFAEDNLSWKVQMDNVIKKYLHLNGNSH